MMTGVIAIVPFVWIGLVIVFGVWRRVQSGQPVAPRVPPGATFGETMCSGRVLGGALARLGGANNCLIVTVDRGRLAVSFAFPFNLFPMPGYGALNVDVPASAIARVTPGRRLWQHVLRIDFTDLDRKPVQLVIRNETGLVAALGPGLVPPNAERPLQSKSGPRLTTRLSRVFLCIWGTAFMIGSGADVVGDLAVRAHGLSTSAVMVGFAGRQAMLRYRVNGVAYTMASHFNGTWKPGQTATVFYLPDDPARATESGMLPLEVLMMLFGLTALIIGMCGPRLLPGWS